MPARTQSRFALRASLRATAETVCAGLLILLITCPATYAQPNTGAVQVYSDPSDDWLLRPMDPNGALPYDAETHHPADLLETSIGQWQPTNPMTDPFSGQHTASGKYFRLNLRFVGLVNPPGCTRPWNFVPFKYGAHPVYGFVELDVDVDEDTGGELDAPEYRYTANAVRFGGKPAIDALDRRFALSGADLDGDIETEPYVDRSGEEFHLAMLGSVFNNSDITVKVGDSDFLFESGETWWIKAPWLHRAHGYEPFSLATGGSPAGVYEPNCILAFSHDATENITQVSLVFPLTNEGSAEMRGEPVEPLNSDPSDQASVLEALDDLVLSAMFIAEFPTGLPEERIITDWENKTASDYLEPTAWRVTAILGTSYTASPPEAEYFVWTDISPGVVRGDITGDGEPNWHDTDGITAFISEHDLDDGQQDGQVVLFYYPVNFDVHDIDHSGVIDELDSALVSIPGNLDGDTDVDLADFATLQTEVTGSGTPYAWWESGLVDFDTDGDVDAQDMVRFFAHWSGPDIMAE